MRRSFLFCSLLLALLVGKVSLSQDFSNKGKEFWLSYSYHVGMSNGQPPTMTLYLTCDVTTTYTVEIFGVTTIQTGTISAGAVVPVVIPTAYFINNEGLFTSKAIRVTADKNITVYSYITRSAVSGATLCLPTTVLGREYYSANFTQVSNENNSNSYFTIVAVEDNTTVEITPAGNTKNGWVANTMYTVNLNKGQIYQVMGTTSGFTGSDLTGSLIRSVSSTSGGCKRIAVFSGSGKIRIPSSGCGNNSSDNLYQQLYPVASWGKKYLTVPSYNRPNNYYRIIRSSATANVTLNGTLIPAGSFTGNYYQFFNNTPNNIESDQPIAVFQYFTTQGCDGNGTPYDPDMVALNPVEQNISNVTLVSSNMVAAPPEHHLHVIMKNGTGTGISSFRLDGATVPATSWVTHPRDPSYSYLYLANVAQGYHRLVSDSGFLALAYGYAPAESYAYSAGANVKDLYQFVSVQNQYATVNYAAACRNSPFYFKMTFPYQPTAINWDLGTLGTFNMTNPAAFFIGTIIVNGKTLYQYQIPNPYSIAATGTYPIRVTANNPTSDGCGGSQEINYDLQVFNNPVANFDFNNVCFPNPVVFTETSNTDGRPINTRYWDFGDLSNGSTSNPTHAYASPGTYNVRYSIITDIGCISDTITRVVNVSPLPTASISGATQVCVNDPSPVVTFTGGTGQAPFTFTYTINGGAPQTITTTSGNTVSVPVSTTSAGTFTYSLVSVSDGSPAVCSQAQTGTVVVQVNPLPTASIAGTVSVCRNAPSPVLTFTGAGSTAPYTFTYNINGGADQTVTTTSGNTVTITVPTTTAGIFTYNLVRVQGAGNTACSQSQTGSVTVTVNELPTASISGTTDVCLNSTSPVITFTGASGTAPYTFTYTLNGGANQTIVSNGNTVTIPVPTTTVGTFTYNLVSVSDASSNACSQLQSGTAIVTVNPSPTASIAGTVSVCRNGTPPVITFTGAGPVAPYTFTYNINGGANQTVTTTTGNSVTIVAPTTAAGIFTYNLVSVQGSGPAACSQSQTGSVTVTVNELPTASISGNTDVCLNAASPLITFTGALGTAPYTFTYTLNGGSNQTIVSTGNTVTIPVPTTTTGTFTYNLVSVSDASSTSCNQLQSGTATVTVNPLPTASISGATQVCMNDPSPVVTFTGGTGQAPYTFTYTINGGAPLTVTSTSGNTATVSVPTTSAGTFTYSLVSVSDSDPATCSQAQTGTAVVQVNPLPTASISGTVNVCRNGPSPVITFTGTGSVAPYTFTYTINGGANQTVTTTSGNSVTVVVPTSTTGTFTYNLVQVQGAGATACSQSQTGSATVTVNELPTASISGNTEVCLNAASPLITFTGATGTAPYTFTYKINGGANQTIVSTGNTVTLPVPTNTAGTFTYSLVSISDNSPAVCSQPQTGTATVIVNPLPTPDFILSTPRCETRLLNFTDASAANAGTINSWNWNFGDAGTATVQNPTHTYATAGTYNVTLSVTTNKGCTSAPALVRQVTINPLPVASFLVPAVCLSDTYAQFTDNTTVAGGTATSWLWNFGDPGSGANNTSVLQNPQHSYSSVGNYTVSLQVTSNSGCQSTASQPFVVNGDIPVANFNALNPGTMCANDSIAIQDASTVNFGSITKLEIYWDNTGAPGVFQVLNFPAPGQVIRHLYPNFQAPLTRTYNIRYRAFSGATCVSERIKTVQINAAPKVQFNPIPNICYDAAPFQITQATEIGGVPGSGVFSGPGVNATGLFNPALVGPGTYSIKYKFTSIAGGCMDSLSSNILVYDTASARFTYSTLACERTAIQFNSTTSVLPATAGTITGWAWDFGDPASGANNISTLQNPSHVFSSWGNYTVSLVVITSNGCRSAVRTQSVFVNPLPRPNFSFPPSSCLPAATVSFSNLSSIPDNSQGSFTYLWNFGDPGSGANNSSTGSSPSHIYNTAGPFNVNLQVTSGAGCVRDTTIVVATIHPQPTGSFTVDKTDVCVGDAFTFNDNSNPADGTAQQWNWTMGDGNTRNLRNFTYIYTTAGSFDVTLFITNNFGCRSTSFTRSVTVNPYPTVNAGPDVFILENGSDTLQPVVSGINPTYLWTPNQYFLSSNTVKNPVVKGVADITYTLTVTGRGGCTASDQVFIKVLKGPEVPNIFSPNGDGVHDTWVIKYLDTYPGSTVEVFNRYGQLIFRSVGYPQPWDGTVNGKPVPIGTYYYIVDPKNGRAKMSGYVDVIR